jgi:hypothetical protein
VVLYIPRTTSTALATLPVTSISAVAHEALPCGLQRVNHWSLLVTPPSNIGYTSLDMTPTGVDNAGCLIISQRSNKDGIWKEVPLRLAGGMSITVEKLVGVVKENGMEQYTFTGSGIGCRFWVVEVVKRWKSVGLVEGGDEDLEQVMGRVWDHKGAEAGEAVEMERGTWE